MNTKMLRILINTLNKISVNGESNINMMLACITLLKSELQKTEEQEGNNEEIHPAE
jgi:hypothetical protein